LPDSKSQNLARYFGMVKITRRSQLMNVGLVSCSRITLSFLIAAWRKISPLGCEWLGVPNLKSIHLLKRLWQTFACRNLPTDPSRNYPVASNNVSLLRERLHPT